LTRKGEWLKSIRNEELVKTKQFFPKNKTKLLEIGGKDGYLANILEKWGFHVTSIDLMPTSEFFDVKKMNGEILEFDSNSFEIIFSSHVIAHVENKEVLFSEIKRVLKHEGIIIHIVPSRFWVILTSFWHYILLPKMLFFKIPNLENKTSKKNEIIKSKKSKLINQIFLHPLGTNKSFLHEIVNFSKNNWTKLFLKNGFEIISIINGPLGYSGYSVFNHKGMKIRKKVSSIFSSSYVFVMKKIED